MRLRRSDARCWVAALVLLSSGSPLLAGPKFAVVDFENVALGTSYGPPMQAPGDSIFMTNEGVDVAVDAFVGRGEFTEFFRAEVGGRYADAFPTRSLSLDNISVVFDYSLVDFLVREISLQYIDLSDAIGASNFSVNGAANYLLNPFAKLPPLVAPGVTATVTDTELLLSAGPGGIQSLRIGGQELVIDNVMAVPEPASLVLLLLGAIALFGRFRRAAA